MNIRWDNPDKTYVRVDVMGTVYQIPANGNHPDWLNIKAMIDAGTLVVSDYELPPVSDE